MGMNGTTAAAAKHPSEKCSDSISPPGNESITEEQYIGTYRYVGTTVALVVQCLCRALSRRYSSTPEMDDKLSLHDGKCRHFFLSFLLLAV